ncbi:MAG TPA: HYR domain-containing protein [Verrucomicrobiae bacterium]|nr:HYR domain-containing protein [Verrucomicrobiae bacterium]
MSYDPGTKIFAIDAPPTSMRFTSTEAARPITGTKDVSIRILVDNSGALIGGVPANGGNDLVVSGTVQRVVGTVTNTYSGVLLAGSIMAFGYAESGATDQYDLRFTVAVTGGALSNYFTCGIIGVTVSSEASTFTGSFATAFQGRAKGNVGLEDITPPVVTCPDTIVQECNAHTGGAPGAYVTYPPPVATDNCTDPSLLTYSYSPPSGSFFPLDPGNMSEDYPVTLTVTDPSGNSTSCTFTVTIKDDQAPAFDNNSSPLIEPCDTAALTFPNDPGLCSAVVTLIKPTATDCCSESVSVSVSAVDANNHVIVLTDLGNGMVQGTFPGGTNTVTVVADDGNGNTAQSICPVVVNDVEPPVIDCEDLVVVATNCVTICNQHNPCDPFDRGCGRRGGCFLRRACNKFGGWWWDKCQDKCEIVQDAVVPVPDVTDNCDDEVDVTTDPPPGTQLGVGVHTITATAVDDAGNTSTCTFTVTVLAGVQVVFNCSLQDDNKPDNIETDADALNRFSVCSKIPVCVNLVDLCTKKDITASLASSVTVILDVSERAGSYNDSVLVQNLDENPSDPGDDGTIMAYKCGQFCYTLNTKGYEKGTLNNNHFFRADVRVYYKSNPDVLVGREDASLESTATSCSCY